MNHPVFNLLKHLLGKLLALDFENCIQNDHGDLTLDFVDLDSGAPPVCPFTMPSLPNFHLSKYKLNY